MLESRRPGKVVVAAATIVSAVTLVVAGKATDIEIRPGPPAMSAGEQAIVADVARGSQHGVILVEETEREDNLVSEMAYHLRAKILSPEGRSLADVTIPTGRGASDLKTWWGRTILPDGRVLELRQTDLQVQSVARTSSGEYRQLKGALPGVVPGCVIDYGYVILQDGFVSSTRVFLQKSWPVRSFVYRWIPNQSIPAAFVTSHVDGRPVDVKHDRSSVVVTAHDLDPVPEEPHMPPLGETRASVTFYYAPTNEQPEEYWKLRAKRADAAIQSFCGRSGALKDTLQSMAIPAEAPLQDKLRTIYDWLAVHVKNTGLMSAEEQEADEEESETYNARMVLRAGEATPRQLDLLFAGLARAVGAEANLVFAVDRTERFWEGAYKSMDQFSYSFVAVRPPGGGANVPVLIDAGSGLPYGELPWRATAARSLLCTPAGASVLAVPPAPAEKNRTETRAEVRFDEDNATMTVHWTRTANGAAGLDQRRWLRHLDVRKRKEALDALCGGSGRVDVTSADLPGLDKTVSPFEITCDLEIEDTNLDDDIGRYSLPILGAWWPETPELPSTTRVHPVVFDYLKADTVTLDITAPHGFEPGDVPEPVELETAMGRYQLVVKKTPTGYHVDRGLAVTALIVEKEDYGTFRKFLEEVRNADRTTVTFTRAPDSE